ncbi:unnamed protein product [Pylaiella littoralis]
MATTSHPATPPREPKRKRDTALDNFGLGSDDEVRPSQTLPPPPGVSRKVQVRTPLGPQSPNAATAPVYVGTARDLEQSEEEEEEERQTSDEASSDIHTRRIMDPVDPQYADMTAERLFAEGHIAIGLFSYNHPLFSEEAAAFNEVKIDGKHVWQQQPSGPSSLHNISVVEYFTSLVPFLGGLQQLCKTRPSTDCLFKKQRAQQYTKSGRRHRDGKNGRWRACITCHDPGAPTDFKQLEVGVADARQAKGGGAVNPFGTKSDGTPDVKRFDCPSGSYHITDEVATGSISHAHRQAIIDETRRPKHGAETTFVIDIDPIKPDTFIEDVARIARGTADVVRAGLSVSAYVPPPTLDEIGVSCGSQQTEDWNKLQQENLESYIEDRRVGGEQE